MTAVWFQNNDILGKLECLLRSSSRSSKCTLTGLLHHHASLTHVCIFPAYYQKSLPGTTDCIQKMVTHWLGALTVASLLFETSGPETKEQRPRTAATYRSQNTFLKHLLSFFFV